MSPFKAQNLLWLRQKTEVADGEARETAKHEKVSMRHCWFWDIGAVWKDQKGPPRNEDGPQLIANKEMGTLVLQTKGTRFDQQPKQAWKQTDLKNL